MVVIPFTYLKPGLWELRCCGDIMSDFLGNSWQQVAQLQVLPKATDVLPTREPASPTVDADQKDIQESLSETITSSADSNPAIKGLLPVPVEEGDSLSKQEEHLETASAQGEENCSSPLTPSTSPALDAGELWENLNAHPEEKGNSCLPCDASLPAFVEAAPTETGTTPVIPLAAESVALSASDEELQIEEGNGLVDEHSSSQSKLLEEDSPSQPSSPQPSAIADSPILSPYFNEVQPEPGTLVNTELEPAESDKERVALTNNSAESATPTNAILDRSLQMLEQILQQVLEPVLQELEQPESPNPDTPVEPESELLSEAGTNPQGLILTLNDDGLVARQGEPLIVTGQVDALDVNQFNGSQTSSASNHVFQGSLRYELRDPQTSNVLIDVRHSLSEQALPIVFSHTLEIPPECNTRLFLGRVILYGATPTALASQPFTVTADLDELLGAIIPGSKVMPVAKMMVIANKLAATEDDEAEQLDSSPPLSQPLLDLIDTRRPQTSSLQPSSGQHLPPQIYQSSPDRKPSKSLNLPNFPKVQPAFAADSSTAPSAPDQDEAKQEDSVEQPIALDNELSSETPNLGLEDTSAEDTALELHPQETVKEPEDATLEEDTVSEVDFLASAWDETELLAFPVPVTDSGLETSNTLETAEHSESSTDFQLAPSDATDALAGVDSPNGGSDAIAPKDQVAEVPVTQSVGDRPAAVDNAFQALKVQDRFWLRLNSLAADAQLSQWLKSDLSFPSNPAEVEEVAQLLNPDPILAEVEEDQQQLNSDRLFADFDESIWEEESEHVGNAIAHTDGPQPLVEETNSPEVEMPEQLPSVEVVNTDWADREIVVEDEDFLAPEQPTFKHDASGRVYPTKSLDFQPELGIVPPQQLESALPAPILSIPTSELAAGEPVVVRVKLPPHSARLCIKLWVQDRQSRSLLDEPRWLVDLIPDGAGAMEAMTQLIVPFGSVEIRFEAIAVDIYSQRESHKVAVDCVVVPPDLPDFSLDEFET